MNTPDSELNLSYNSQLFLNIIDYQEYYLTKKNIIYKIIIGKNKNEIFIKSRVYFISLNCNDLSILTHIKFDSINEAYKYLINIFEENIVIIKDITFNKEMIIKINNENGKEIEITLLYNNENNDIIISEIRELKKEIVKLKVKNNKLEMEIKKLKEYDENNNPKDIQLLSDIVDDSFAGSNIDNSFCIFNSINNILFLIYSNQKKSIICYDLNNQNKIKEIKNYHNEYINNFRHYLDEINKRDLIMSVSGLDNNIKIWNVNNWECIINITNINKNGFLFSSCFLSESNQINIISSNRNVNDESEPIKVFDINGKKIKEIYNSNEPTFFIDVYHDNILSKNFIIAGMNGYIKSYDFNKNELYHIYKDKNNADNHISIIIKENKGIIKLIESCNDGNIRMWNFHNGILLNIIKISNEQLKGICLWNDNYLFVGCKDTTIKLVELNNGLKVKELNGHNNQVITIKKIIHNKYGECLISQNLYNSKIKLWKINY